MGESAWDRVRRAFRREKRELDDVVADAEARADEALDRKERELAATPEERLEIERQRAAEQDEEFEALRRKIDPSA